MRRANLWNTLSFAFQRALPISVLDLIVSVSHCASITLLRWRTAPPVGMFIRELSVRQRIDFSRRRAVAHFGFPVQRRSKFRVRVAWEAARQFASAYCLH